MVRSCGAGGLVYYNGFQFPSQLNANVTCEPVADDNDWIVKYHRYHLTIECVLIAADFPQPAPPLAVPAAGSGGRSLNVDPPMDVLRKILQEPGATLSFRYQGFGDEIVVSRANDMEFGPKPRLTRWEPVGTSRCVRVTWECDFAVTECYGGLGSYSHKFVSFGYTMVYGINEDGATTRSMNGWVEVMVHRSGTPPYYIDNSADEFRDLMAVPLLDGYKRSQNYTLSPDRRRLDYTITDTEIPSDNPYFPYCLQMDIRHSIRGKVVYNPSPAAGAPHLVSRKAWEQTVSGTITVAPMTPRYYAWDAFVNIVDQRLARRTLGVLPGNKDKDDPAGGKAPALLNNFETEEDIFGRTLTFSFSWELLCTVESLLEASGLWLPTDSTWGQWSTSIQSSSAYAHRGHTGLQHLYAQDRVVNVCGSTPPYAPIPAYDKPKKTTEPVKQATKNIPPEGESWIAYDLDVEHVNDTGVLPHRPLGPTGDDEGQYGVGSSLDEIDVASGNTASSEDIIQRRSKGTEAVILRGYAARVYHKIAASDCYFASTVDGKTARLIRSWHHDFPTGLTADKLPIYRKSWTAVYVLPKGNANVILSGIPDAAKPIAR